MFRIVLLILALCAAAAGLVIGTLNPDSLVIDLLVWQPELPLGLALVACFVLGLVCGLVLALALFGLPAGWRRVRHRRQASDSSDTTALRVND